MSAETSAAAAMAGARRIVVKVGSALVARGGEAAADWLASLAGDIAGLRARGADAVIVTSGAIALGRRRLGLHGRLRLDEKQAAAAVGQSRLIEAWQSALTPHDIVAAQVLLTLDDTEDRRRYLNARATIAALLAARAVPVINENDTVATSEIRYGDNDRLSAHAAQLSGADLLVLLSDIDGLYTADPRRDPNAAHLPVIEKITLDIEAMAGGANALAAVGSGGMATKIAAAKIATGAGCGVIIANGEQAGPLAAIAAGARATWFPPQSTPDRARRQWIGGRLKPTGALIVDAGAASALANGASLLAAGVAGVEGDFMRGDAVTVVTSAGVVIAQGLAAYDAVEIRRIAGLKTGDVESALGYRRGAAIIHRDDLALTGRSANNAGGKADMQ